jgi:hypothetical protein
VVGFERALKDATVVHQVIFATVKKNIGLLVTPHQDEVVGSDEDDGPGSSVLLSNGITLRSQGTLLVLVGGTTSSTSTSSSSSTR